jgi:ParB/RepB/Spo0J family partition protein
VKDTISDDQRSSPTSTLRPDAANVRTAGIDTKDPGFRSLVESIRIHGILQPLTVRPDGLIVCGHRRHAAAVELQLEEVPVSVRNIADEDLVAVRLIENLQREDLDPIDESDAFAALEKNGVSIAEICERAQVSETTVRRRLKLQLLPAKVKKALRAGTMSTTLGVAIGRIPSKKARGEAIKFASTNQQWRDEPPSESEVLRKIHSEWMTGLQDAPFDTADADLIKKRGACGDCQFNSRCNLALFPDLAEEDQAYCTDVDCFAEKKDAHVTAAAQGMRDRGLTVYLADDDQAGDPFDWQGRLKYGSKWTEASSVPGGQPKKGRKQLRTLAKGVEIIGLVDPKSGNVVEVMDAKKAAAALKKEHAWAKKAASTGTLGMGSAGGGGNAENRAADRRRAKVRSNTLEQLRNGLKLEDGSVELKRADELTLMGILFTEAMRDDDARQLKKLFEIEVGKDEHQVGRINEWAVATPELIPRKAMMFLAVRFLDRDWAGFEDTRAAIFALFKTVGVNLDECAQLAEADVQVAEDAKQEREKKKAAAAKKKAAKKKGGE